MTQLAVTDRGTLARAGELQGSNVAPVFAEGDTWSMVSDNELALIEANPAEPTTATRKPYAVGSNTMTTTVSFESEAIDLLARASADELSVYEGLGHVAAAGMLGALAKDLAALAEQVEKSGYVPPAKRAEYERHDRLAKSVQDRELTRYHRDKAREIRAQLGEGK